MFEYEVRGRTLRVGTLGMKSVDYEPNLCNTAFQPKSRI